MYILALISVCRRHTPKLEFHIVLNMQTKWKDHTREMRKLVGMGMVHSIPLNSNAITLCHGMGCLPRVLSIPSSTRLP